jgi:hypothetical protein
LVIKYLDKWFQQKCFSANVSDNFTITNFIIRGFEDYINLFIKYLIVIYELYIKYIIYQYKIEVIKEKY